jgi:hypothetical protein
MNVFKPGDKVICIDPGNNKDLIKDAIYTVHSGSIWNIVYLTEITSGPFFTHRFILYSERYLHDNKFNNKIETLINE